ncbi:biopolymer transporter ExbD [Methanobrevibacter sp. TMH8]|uniref:biopolymer transporter ExbD n=1 Tax=Methanobrevibacter sp. TMH8 TaxID=2848611 RepID=UPI001CCAC4B9|nr:biopolymer transporter ExbD [Methanobrevibacter sp. TMH8]MBZ9571187.1 biopolymer transporter ExbD [Methanobrevibacter sp. TMH8]
MALDIKRHRQKIKETGPEFNLVPFIDILFTLLIFLVVSSSFSTAGINDATDSGTGKPNITDTSGTSEYYLLPVAGLEKVTVNGQDMSALIKDHAIAVQTKVIDQGEIIIKPKERAIIITAPPGMSPEQAVRSPD